MFATVRPARLISQAATDHGKQKNGGQKNGGQKNGGQKNGAENVIFLPAIFLLAQSSFFCPPFFC
jgi:hypothetical protein